MEQREGAQHELLLARLHGSFTEIYLTMLSIIQGVALADLIGVVAGSYPHFTFAQWIMTATQLWIIVAIWTHFMYDAMSRAWVPTVIDSAQFFGAGATEAIGNHAIVLGLPLWLGSLAFSCAVGVILTYYIRWREEQHVTDHNLLILLRHRTPLHVRHFALFTGIFALATLLTLVAGIDVDSVRGLAGVVAAGIAAIGIIYVGTFTAITVFHWQHVIHYARTGKLPRQHYRAAHENSPRSGESISRMRK